MNHRVLLLLLTTLSLVPPLTQAAAIAFQDPATASWGNWTRDSAGSVYVAYDVFGNPHGLGTTPVLPDTTPDKGAFGTAAANGSILLTKKKGSTATPAAFITGSGNIYSFSDVLDFDLIIQPGTAHTALGSRPITVALQLSILGSDLDFSSVKLLGQSWMSKTVLSSGAASGPSGTGVGVDNEYLFIWQLSAALPVYTFDFSARDTSLSLEALAVDIGPALSQSTPVAPSTPGALPASVVPLPPAIHLSAVVALMLLTVGRRRQKASDQSASVGSRSTRTIQSFMPGPATG